MAGDGSVLGVAAAVAVVGLPVERFLYSADPVERLALAAIASRALELVDQLQRNQAVHVVNMLGKAMRR